MGKSSKDKRDAYYRLAKEQNWRARSAFKLIQIDEHFDLFAHSDPDSVTRVVDLCAAPGSWSQVLSRVLIKGESFGRRAWEEKRAKQLRDLRRCEEETEREHPEKEAYKEEEECAKDEEDESQILKPRKNVRIVAVDLQPMAPLDGITALKADITHPSTIPLLLKALDPDLYNETETETETKDKPAPSPSQPHPHPVDLVLSDGAPDVTGLHDLDIYIQSQLLYAALNLAIGVLRPGGKFVAKIFRGRDVDLIYAQLKTVFEKVSVAKPRSSRASSLEAFVVCEGFTPPPVGSNGKPRTDFDTPIFGGAKSGTAAAALEEAVEADNMRWIPPFIACGDLSAWDADASYELPPDHVSLDPVQPPTAPPYKRALELKKARGGAYGKTKGVTYDV
ncbi:tRNA (uridine-2'-O-)-methyltransferase trm7 [Emydomyces testavorans]|uniref:Putative tRNA (cytidine(32)/guanosine(34)-2'-O)-methyltransferase n=1 Tax=Emydomyces testavorans TaxID=2070801 RepID=A0AAF0IJ17_9EURO|nr:tRNA (uridine-2'-O-)-methyltransferase trm7 [Emydomyces testavorans]